MSLSHDTHLILDSINKDTYHAARETFRRIIVTAHSVVIGKFEGDGTQGGSNLNTRTGYLRRSVKFKVSGHSLTTLNASIFSDSIYAPIHEYGGVIKAKRAFMKLAGAPYLSIPLDSNKTPSGVTKQKPKAVFDGGGYIIRSKTGKYLIMSGGGKPMYVLVKKVTIPPRLGIVTEINRALRSIQDIYAEELGL